MCNIAVQTFFCTTRSIVHDEILEEFHEIVNNKQNKRVVFTRVNSKFNSHKVHVRRSLRSSSGGSTSFIFKVSHELVFESGCCGRSNFINRLLANHPVNKNGIFESGSP